MEENTAYEAKIRQLREKFINDPVLNALSNEDRLLRAQSIPKLVFETKDGHLSMDRIYEGEVGRMLEELRRHRQEYIQATYPMLATINH